MSNIDDTYKDPVYNYSPKIVPAGESIIWALAKEKCTFEKQLCYPAEDVVYEEKKLKLFLLKYNTN